MHNVLIATHPGGALLFNKTFSTTPTPQEPKWEAWSLAALLSSMQLYSTNVSRPWHVGNPTTATPSSPSTVPTVPTAASLSCFTFNQSTYHFWYQQNKADTKHGTLTMVKVRGAPSKENERLTRTISEAFAKHCDQKEITQPMRGFSSPFRQVLHNHFTYLMQRLASLLFDQCQTNIPNADVVVQLPAPPTPPTQPALTHSSNGTAKAGQGRPPTSSNPSTIGTSTVQSPPPSSADTSKSTRPKRHFLRFFRRSSKSSKTKAAKTKAAAASQTAPVLLPIASTTTPSTTTAPTASPSTTSQSSKPPTRNSVTYSFALQGTPSILRPTTKATEAMHNTNDSIQQTCVSTTEYKDALGDLDLDLQVQLQTTSDPEATLVHMTSVLVTLVFPWNTGSSSNALNALPKKTIDLVRNIHGHAALLAIKTKKQRKETKKR
jgi:hypothetical protein